MQLLILLLTEQGKTCAEMSQTPGHYCTEPVVVYQGQRAADVLGVDPKLKPSQRRLRAAKIARTLGLSDDIVVPVESASAVQSKHS